MKGRKKHGPSEEERASDLWRLAELVRTSPLPRWSPWSIAFHRESRFRGGGRPWEADFYLELGPGGGGQVELRVSIAEVDGRRARTSSERVELLRFLDTLQEKLWRAGFGGRFVEDPFDGYGGEFNKYLSGIDVVLSEIAALDEIGLGE